MTLDLMYDRMEELLEVIQKHGGSGLRTPRDERLEDPPLKILTNKSNHFFTWGMVEVASHMAEFNVTTSNIRNQFIVSGEYGWYNNLEAEFTYERYLNDWFRLFGGINVENEEHDILDEISTTAIAGIRFFTPYMFNLDLRVDNKLRPQISIKQGNSYFSTNSYFW